MMRILCSPFICVCAAEREKINKSQEKPIMWKHMLIIKQNKIVFIYTFRKKMIYLYKYPNFHTAIQVQGIHLLLVNLNVSKITKPSFSFIMQKYKTSFYNKV